MDTKKDENKERIQDREYQKQLKSYRGLVN